MKHLKKTGPDKASTMHPRTARDTEENKARDIEKALQKDERLAHKGKSRKGQ